MLTGKSENPVISSAKRNSTKYRLHLMILCLTLAINVALPDFCSTATYGNPILAPGSGFTGLTSEPGPIGTSGQGYDAKAIARWDVVPYQTFNDTFHIGVVAFHMIGIDRVEFSVDGGPWHNVSEMTSNPRTGVVEYWATLEASDFSDGLIEVRAIAYPTIGQPRLLDSLYLYANAGNTLPIGNTVYIKTTGNDSNNGSMSSPMRTITNAIDAAGDGGKVIILDEGLYELHSTQQRRAFFFRNERYITVEASAGLNRDNVIIGWPIRQQSRPKVGKMHFKGVSFDFSTISQYYLGGYVWFEKCRWFQSDGWATSYSDLRIPVRKAGDIYITDSLAEDMIYGFVSAKLVRNSTTQKISGDAYQNSQMVLNCRAVNINGDILSHHTDIYQIWGQNENFIVYGLDTDNIVKTQCMFLDHDNSSHINYAFVNIYFDCFDPGGSPPHTQFNAAHNHVIFRNVRWPGQQISFRDDFAGEKKFTANNVIFENCELYPENYDRYVLRKYSWGRGTPEGVTFDNCYPSTGSASPVLDAIGNKFINENSTLTFDVNATDPEGASVAIYNKGLPSGATFSNWTFSWTPSYYQAGDYEVTFTASDGRNYDSETITITVNNVNRPPVLDAISDRSVNENALLSFSVNATDPDGEAITYSVSGLPTGAVFAGQTFTWTPSYIQAGSHNIKFTASDGMAEDSQVMTITVNNVNIAPALTSIGNKSVYASQLLTFSVHATDFDGGSITYSATGMPSGATFASQTFNWTPNSSQAGTHDVTFIANDGENLNSETITITVDIDTLAPTVTNCSPNNDAIQVPLNNIISLSITDADTGVDADSVTIRLNSNIIYTGDTNHYKSSNGNCHRKGTTANYTFIYQSNETFDYDQTMAITVNATDIAENSMTEYSSSFATEMRAFGKNKRINSATKLDSDKPVTVCDSNGNIWAAWHAGPSGQRDIYVGKLAAGSESFGSTIQVTKNSADQCQPAIALGNKDKLYVVWQDNREGDWDIYISSSNNGTGWAGEKRVNDPNEGNQINPDIVIDNGSPNRVHVAWQDDRLGNQDICIATSNNGFGKKSVTQITNNSADQTEPAVTADSANTIYVVWTDTRDGSQDIYGAASNNRWTNVEIISNAANQSSPAVAAESAGSILHMLWTDDTPGDNDIYYASSNGLPGSPIIGSSIVDDSSGADQQNPSITVKGSAGNNLRVFACWQDYRNTDTDLYFVELSSGLGATNIFVGDEGSNTYQGKPAIGIDDLDHPYLLWVDNRNTYLDIYYTGSTFVEPDSLALATKLVNASINNIVGTNPVSISDEDDVSIAVSAGTFSCDVDMTISKINNPQTFTAPCLSSYDFGPSGIQFNQPVTVTIPYTVSSSTGSALPYWYNSLTGALSQQGITDVQDIAISPTLHAISFKTTHFTPFYVLGGGGGIAGALGGGGGGGGCSLSTGNEGNIFDFILPYIGLAVAMLIIKVRDARQRKLSNITAGKY